MVIIFLNVCECNFSLVWLMIIGDFIEVVGIGVYLVILGFKFDFDEDLVSDWFLECFLDFFWECVLIFLVFWDSFIIIRMIRRIRNNM